MANKDSYNNLYPATSLPHMKRSSSENGAAVDLAGYNSATIIVSTGPYTDGTHIIAVEDSDAAGSGFAAVASGSLLGAEPTIAASGLGNNQTKIGYIGGKRYVRINSAVTGVAAGGGAEYGAIVLRAHKRHNPTL